MLDSYLESNFDVLPAATGNRYADNSDLGMVKLGPIALYSNSKLTTSKGKHLKDITLAHNVSLL